MEQAKNAPPPVIVRKPKARRFGAQGNQKGGFLVANSNSKHETEDKFPELISH